MNIQVWWIRRDLRLDDNFALRAALEAGGALVPLFILDPLFEESPWVGAARRNFLWAGLHVLDQELRERGSRLLIRSGNPVEVLGKLASDGKVAQVFAEADHSPYGVRRDEAVGNVVNLRLTGGVTALPVDKVRKDDGSPYTVFTPFRNRWREELEHASLHAWAAPNRFPAPPEWRTEELPAVLTEQAQPFVAGTVEARRRLRAFVFGSNRDSSSSKTRAPVYQYKELRNRPDLHATSQLSPYLRFGHISAQAACVAASQAMHEAPSGEAAQSAAVWLDELTWREFYVSILHHFPHVRSRSFRPEYDAIRWRNDRDEFDAWCKGETGYPLVDAAMRQLRAEGWMHNRARMVVASFLVKDLLVDWRWGEKWFMQQLIDGDPAANNGGWQWTAGTGTDAAPYFRVFNPSMQAAKFDPNGDYIRAWLPELTNVPTKHIHEPWKMTGVVQDKVGCCIGRDYPAPIVDHHAARQRTLDAYQAAKDESKA